MEFNELKKSMDTYSYTDLYIPLRPLIEGFLYKFLGIKNNPHRKSILNRFCRIFTYNSLSNSEKVPYQDNLDIYHNEEDYNQFKPFLLENKQETVGSQTKEVFGCLKEYVKALNRTPLGSDNLKKFEKELTIQGDILRNLKKDGRIE